MKSAQEHYENCPPNIGEDYGEAEEQWIKGIQADALRHAAELCTKTPTCGGSGQMLARRLKAEADQLSPEKKL